MFFASNRIADVVAVGPNAPRTTPSRRQPRPSTRRTTRTLGVVVGAVLAATMALPAVSHADEPFGLKTFSNQTTDTNGDPYAVAGGHPDLNVTEFSISSEAEIVDPGMP